MGSLSSKPTQVSASVCGVKPMNHASRLSFVVPVFPAATFRNPIARQGARLSPRAIRFVTDDRGKEIKGAGRAEPQQVFPQRDVFLLTHVMEGVVNRGTAGSARGMGFRKVAAGKTGTTNDKRDAWFIGFTPQTLALTWVGFDDNDPTGLSGSDAAVPMWTRYMLAVTAGQKDVGFAVPPGITFTEVDRTSGALAGPYCPRNVVLREAFKTGTEPASPCPLHQAPVAPTPVPMYDEYGNLIITTTTDPNAIPTDTGYVPPSTPPDATLTGGVFRPEPTTTAPPPRPVPPPPATTTTQPPPPTTTTEEPPPPTNTDTTGTFRSAAAQPPL